MNYRKSGIASTVGAPFILLKLCPFMSEGELSFITNYMCELIFAAAMICSVIAILKLKYQELDWALRILFMLEIFILVMSFLGNIIDINFPLSAHIQITGLFRMVSNSLIIILCMLIKTTSWFNNFKRYIYAVAGYSLVIAVIDMCILPGPALLPFEYICSFLLCALLGYSLIAREGNVTVQENILYELSTK